MQFTKAVTRLIGSIQQEIQNCRLDYELRWLLLLKDLCIFFLPFFFANFICNRKRKKKIEKIKRLPSWFCTLICSYPTQLGMTSDTLLLSIQQIITRSKRVIYIICWIHCMKRKNYTYIYFGSLIPHYELRIYMVIIFW